MPTSTILLLLLALIVSAAVAGFQYFYKSKGSLLQNGILASLRFITLFALLVLIVDPQIKQVEYFTEKPNLVLAIDNSSSIADFGENENVQNLVGQISEDPDLQERFNMEIFKFGRELQQDDELTFDDSQTNIPSALKNLNELYDQQRAPTILISDGNQTLGEELIFAARRFNQPLMPVVVGDTTLYQDLNIFRVNTNKYAFQNNFFPVEMMVNYSGKGAVNSRIRIISGDVTLFSEDLNLDETNNSVVVQAKLPSVSVGVNTYQVRVRPLPEEKNVLNNEKEFAVEVIDERTSILMVYNTLHPDLGAIKKAIESNQYREVKVQQIGEAPLEVDDYQLVILYQPTRNFKPLLDELTQLKRNYWVIAGPETDWRFLNTQQELFQQEYTVQTEEYFPLLNQNFTAFQTEDIGYSSFPPLQGSFGNLNASEGVETLLYRRIQGIETQEPLLSISDQKEFRVAYLFGAELWKWRSHVYLENGSFEAFDELIGKLVQYLSSERRKERLSVSYEPLYQGRESLVISAEYFDRNYVFDPRGDLELRLENEGTGEVQHIPFMLSGSNYRVDLSNIPAGEYAFTVTVEGEGLSRSGKFRLLDFDVEKQFARANLEVLQTLANSNNQDLYFPEDFEKIKADLLSDDSYVIVQKSRENDVSLVDWYYLLGIIILSLSIEWFLRKYYGYI